MGPGATCHEPSLTMRSTRPSAKKRLSWRSSGLIRRELLGLPQRPGPLGHHLCQAFGCSCMGQPGKKPLGVALTVGSLAACHFPLADRAVTPVAADAGGAAVETEPKRPRAGKPGSRNRKPRS